MRLTEDDIAKLKVLEAMDELEATLARVKPSWLHPAQKMIMMFTRRKLKKLRGEFVVLGVEEESGRDGLEGLGLCTICGEPLVLAQPDCPDPQHH